MKKNIIVQAGSSTKNHTGSWRTFQPETDLEKCIGCSLCAKICPDSAIEMIARSDGKLKPKTNYDYCKGCSLCAAECPVKAIIMKKEEK